MIAYIEDGEKVIAIMRKHWIFPIAGAALSIILAVLPPYMLSVLGNIFPDQNLFPEVFAAKADFLYAIWLLLILMSAFAKFTNFYLDAWVLTNRRIIDINQINFFSRDISGFRLEHIQDVTTEVNGFFATIFNFGTVHVQTAGGMHEFDIPDLENPRKLRRAIMEEQHKVKTSTTPV